MAMDTSGLNDAMIRNMATSESYRRGVDYYHGGMVGPLTRRGETVEAAVQGSQYAPYTVTITFPPDGTIDAACTCPYEWGGLCKHEVAVLLSLLREAGRVEER